MRYEKDRRGECGVRGVYVGVKINDKNINKFLKDKENVDNDSCMFTNNNDYDMKGEFETLSELYDKKDQQLDNALAKIKLLENQLKMSNDIMKMQNVLREKTEKSSKVINNISNMIALLDKKYDEKINQLTEQVNDIQCTVATIENDQMFSDDESDNNSETAEIDPDESDEDETESEDEQEVIVEKPKDALSETMFIKKEKDNYPKIADNVFVNDRTGEEVAADEAVKSIVDCFNI